jgi:F-type H+-transporting ATPase subunit b
MLILQFLILQIIVFSIVIYFLKKILMGDTQTAISRLDLVYQDLLSKQKELNEKIKAAEKEYQDKKQEASSIVEKMKAEALEEIRAKRDEGYKKAKAEAEEIVTKAQESSQKMAQEIEKKMRNKILDFTSNIILRAIAEKNMVSFHNALVEDFMMKGKDLDLSNVGSQIDLLVIRSAMPLQPDVRKQIETLILQRLGRKLTVEDEVNPSLLAGLQLQFGTLILDGSFASAVRDGAAQAKDEPL